jgi:hypothetical protein
MDDSELERPQPPLAPESDLVRLTRSVRRLTLAVWCLAGLLLAVMALPWINYWILSRSRWHANDGEEVNRKAESPPSGESEFDRDFYARPLEEKVKRATVILLTRTETENGTTKEIISEILKKKPGVRFYYDVGKEYDELSRFPPGDCEGCADCKYAGQVVFLMGNPARMVFAETYSKDSEGRVKSGIDLEQLRELARSEQGAEK